MRHVQFIGLIKTESSFGWFSTASIPEFKRELRKADSRVTDVQVFTLPKEEQQWNAAVRKVVGRRKPRPGQWSTILDEVEKGDTQ